MNPTLIELANRATKMGTSGAQDTKEEIDYYQDPNNSSFDLFAEYKKNQTNIPDKSDDNIVFQQESSTNFSFLESTRLFEYKARAFRANLTQFDFVPAELEEYDTYKIPNTATDDQNITFTYAESTIFEFQKIGNCKFGILSPNRFGCL
jgi:hypothetical protein